MVRPSKYLCETAALSTRLPVDLIAALDEIAAVAELSRSEVLESLLRTKHLVGHVHQRGERDCGIAVAAILAGVSYDVSRERCGNDCHARGLSTAEMREHLESLTAAKWTLRRKRQALAHVAAPIACVLIRADGESFGHWVAIKAGVVHDPEFWNGCPEPVYPRRDWPAIYTIAPVD